MKPTTNDAAQFEEALAKWLTLANEIAEGGLSLERGSRYIRVVKSIYGAWAFINTTNGDVLKAASFKKPAKHPRGNIYDDSGIDCLNKYGPKYLR